MQNLDAAHQHFQVASNHSLRSRGPKIEMQNLGAAHQRFGVASNHSLRSHRPKIELCKIVCHGAQDFGALINWMTGSGRTTVTSLLTNLSRLGAFSMTS